MVPTVALSLWFLLVACLVLPKAANSLSNSDLPKVAVVGGGISGLTIAYVLQQSGRYDVHVLEAQPRLGGHVRSTQDPLHENARLNIGHATHMGMFVNLRLLLKHLGIPEWPVGRGSNDQPGLFRMISVTPDGQIFQPPLTDILSPGLWWEAFVFFFDSYMDPQQRLDHYLKNGRCFSKRFLDVLYWAMATFEFDKRRDEAGEYALGAARALLITQVFFQFLLCDCYEGSLPAKIDRGLKDDLASRITQTDNTTKQEQQRLLKCFEEITSDATLASYFTADYGAAMEKLAAVAGRVSTNTTVTQVSMKNGPHMLETSNGDAYETDAVVFTTHPSIIEQLLSQADFPEHRSALQSIESGAVGVRIVHANDLPFTYPPSSDAYFFDMDDPPPILGIFDISELTTFEEAKQRGPTNVRQAGWLSVAFPVYRNTTFNRHQQLLQHVPCVDETVYPWTRATPAFSDATRKIQNIQGRNDIYITGQALTGVNKASELQVTNALQLCHDHFGVKPPWKLFFPCPMLPDCNDVDAFVRAKSPFQAARLAMKSLIGSFLLTSAVARLGVKSFD